jgi:hypothetical protein
MMLVNLRDLKPNPTRDFTVDPIDKKVVRQLQKSIEEDGFWGGVVCRKHNGDIEIAAGQHRVEAALAAEIEKADVFVGKDMDDAAMVRVYARENATQRGNTGTAQIGTVASAVRLLAKEIITGHVPSIDGTSPKSLETLRGQIKSSKGLGVDVIMRLLKGIPEINEPIVQQQIGILKASGNYARILKEIGVEIEEEHPDDQATLDLAQAVTDQVSGQKKIFDLEGVAKHLTDGRHLDTFRKLVTGKGVAPYLDVDSQAGLAKRIVELAKENKQELTSRFIRENVLSMLGIVKQKKRQLSKEEREEVARKDWIAKARMYQDDFGTHVRSMYKAASNLASLAKKQPKGTVLPITGGFLTALDNAEKAIALIRRFVR